MSYYLKITCLFFCLISVRQVIGQRIVFDTVTISGDSYFYSKTDFNTVDSLKFWNYAFKDEVNKGDTAKVKLFGRLYFWRTESVCNTGTSDVVKSGIPAILFDVYSISDTAYCFYLSGRIRGLTSAVPPIVGGDIIIIEPFVLFGYGYRGAGTCSDRDYARPVINYLFSKMEKGRFVTVEQFLSKIEIKRGGITEADRLFGF